MNRTSQNGIELQTALKASATSKAVIGQGSTRWNAQGPTTATKPLLVRVFASSSFVCRGVRPYCLDNCVLQARRDACVDRSVACGVPFAYGWWCRPCLSLLFCLVLAVACPMAAWLYLVANLIELVA